MNLLISNMWEKAGGDVNHDVYSIDDDGLMNFCADVVQLGLNVKPKIPPEWEAAAREFVLRVEAGEVRSVKTYTVFKKLLAQMEPCVHDQFTDMCAKCGWMRPKS